jgi:hypothetical protein
MITTDDIKDFFDKEWGHTEKLFPASDILEELGITGDDTDELLQKYARLYNVNMDGYLWYFHTEEEGMKIFPVHAYERLGGKLPITLNLLADFANKGKWDYPYPEHDGSFINAEHRERRIGWAIVAMIIILLSLMKYFK